MSKSNESDNSTTRRRPPQANTPIAVVGVSALFPGSTESGGFWRDILAGRDLITDVPASHWLIEDYYDPDPKAPDKTYARRGAFLPDVPFDPLAYGIPPTIVPATDTSQLLALIVAQKVLEDAAGGDFSDLDKSRISVILGVTSAQELLANMVGRLQRPVWVKALRESGMPEDEVQRICDRMGEHYQPWQESTFPGLLGNVVAGRIANRFNLGGTNCVTDAACASTLAAVSMAVGELRLGSSDLVITGGADTLNDIFMYMCFSKTPALSPTGDCRPFSDQADGTLLGEGLGMVALKRLADAERDGDRIYAVLKGVGSSSDGRAKSVYAPLPRGQAKAIERAYDEAGYGPETVELVEAHGTGTKAGDAAEFEGLNLSFGDAKEERQWCALGSVKSQIGHTKSAAGAAGLFKIVMALHHKVLPPTIKIDRPNPKLELAGSPFYLNTEARPWIQGGAHPRRGSVSSFGFGGSNFHIAAEEYNPAGKGQRAARLRTFPTELVLLSADSADDLLTRCRELATVDTPDFLTWLAADSQSSFRAEASHRLAVVASDEVDLSKKLGQAVERIEADPAKAFAAPAGIYYRCGEAAGEVAFLFPGQGSQYVGMGADLAMSFDAAADAWDRTAEQDFDPAVKLHQRVFPIPVFDDEARAEQSKALTATEWAQPAIGATSLSQLALLRALGLAPTCVGGHSYGEITALHAAGVFDADAMLQVARRRGELMRDAASTPGAMCAVATTIEKLQPLLETWQQEPWGKDLVMANHNSPKQVVLSGSVDAVGEAEQRLAAERIKAKRLPVGTAFHSPLVSPSSAPFKEFLDGVDVNSPELDSYSNAKAAPYPTAPAAIRQRLAEQIASPVRFVEQIEAMYERGARVFLEVGPGAVLTGLVGKCLGKRPYLAVSLDRKGRHGVTSLWHALGQLATAGQTLNFAALWQEFGQPVDPRSLPKPKMTLSINGSNYDKPYPPPGGATDLPAPNPPRPEGAYKAEDQKAQPQKAVPSKAEQASPSTPAPSTAKSHSKGSAERAEPSPSTAARTASTTSPPAQAPPAQVPAAQTPVQAVQAQAPQPTSGSPAHQAWLGVYQEAQRQTVAAHTAFQQSMANSQTAFLQTVEASFAGLQQLLGGPVPQAAGVAPTVPQSIAPQPVAPQPVVTQPIAPQPVVTQPVVQETPVQAPEPPNNTVEPTPQPVVAQPKPDPAPTAAPPAAAAGPDLASLRQLMIAVVAEKTGYPEEMLQLDMDMEADLGIDSIKRVEILAAMREQAPELPEVDTGQMAALRTLQQIVDYMAQQAPEGTAQAAAPAQETAPQSAEPIAPVAAGPDLNSLRQLMLEVVAEKTGYPTEMLQLDMDMEADLGIDSIKRVEILAAMRERAPELPEVDTGQMAVLRTLQQIVDYMGQGMADATPATPSATSSTASTASEAVTAPETRTTTDAVAASGPDLDSLRQLMLEVVAEKTGYPTDMLQLDMDMEADLGIDSIKRVEILAAMRERAPELPEVDTGQMAVLRTLQQIVDYMAQGGGQNATAGQDAPAPVPVSAANEEATATAVDASPAPAAPTGPDMAALRQLMLDVVAEKTGYPTDMLQLDMDMEADLGIDSIKRVEILAAMRERAPELPEVDTGQMAVLRTLQQIVDYMGQQDGDGEGAAAPSESGAPQSAAESPVETIAPRAERYALRTVEAPSAGFALPGLATAKRLLLTDDGGGVAAALATELATWGLQAEVVQEDAVAAAGEADGLIFLDGLRPEVDLDAALTIGRSAFAAANAVAQRLTAQGGVFVTVQDTGGDFGLGGQSGERAALGALAGLAKTAAQEWPQAGVKAIDLERGERTAKELAAVLVRELLHGGTEREVGLRADGQRLTLESYAAPLETSQTDTSPAVQGGVVVATGGARGVTAATLIALARDAAGRGTPPRLVLLGRTALAEEPAGCAEAKSEADLKRALLQVAQAAGEMPKPKELGAQASRILAAREVRGTVAALAEVGAEARYLPVDVRDQQALAAALDGVRKEWGPITGLVHGAGVIEDRFIADKTLEQVDRVVGTKVDGLRHLLAATGEDPLTLICLFSSVTARCGNRGQADYAMANEILNKIANAEAHRRGGACRVKSLNWGPWKGGMVTPALEARFLAQGVPLIALEEGARMLVEEVQGPDATSVELVLGGEPRPTPLLDEGEEDTRRFDAFINKRSHAYLEGHAIEGSVVFPVVLGLEWFGRLAKAHRPDLELRSLSKLSVLRGIQLADFTGQGEAFQLESVLKSNGSGCVLALELRDHQGRPRYRATAEMAPSAAPSPAAPKSLVGLRPWPELTVYGDVLFHGPSFQVIQQLGGISTEGMAATLQGARHKKWEKHGEESRWLTDSAILDGGLQLAVLWFKNQLGGASLPLSVGTYRSYRSGLLEGPVEAVLLSEARDKDRSVAKIIFSQDDAVVAELDGVEIIRRPAASLAARDAHSQGSSPGLT